MSRDLSKRPTTSDTPISPVPKIDKETLSGMMPGVYEELRRLAASYLRKERPEHTLQRTALVHEAYLRLAREHEGSAWGDRAHFFAIFDQVIDYFIHELPVRFPLALLANHEPILYR